MGCSGEGEGETKGKERAGKGVRDGCEKEG